MGESRGHTTRLCGTLTIHRLEGQIDYQNLRDFVEAFFAEEPSRDLIWDLRDASLDKVHAHELEELAERVLELAAARPGGRTATVFTADAGYGLGRLYETHHELRDSPIEYRAFRSMNDALAWLGYPPEDSSA